MKGDIVCTWTLEILLEESLERLVDPLVRDEIAQDIGLLQEL